MHGITRTRMECSASFGLFLKINSKVSSISTIMPQAHDIHRFIFSSNYLTHSRAHAVVTMDSIQHAAFAMASMSDALAKEAHHEIRMDESSNQIASVQGAYSIIFNCDGRPPSSVYTDHLPSSFLHVPGPASLAPKVSKPLNPFFIIVFNFVTLLL